MIAEVIAIGDELTSGQRLDTNSRWLSERLGECGVRVMFHTTVADDLDAMVAAFRTATDRADLAVCTGGLGPTADDLTRDAMAAVAGVELVEDDKSLKRIKALFRLRKREMPPQNRVQAMSPANSTPIANPHGTAPGIDMTVPRSDGGTCRWFAMPGVPAEMHEMWQATVAPQIRAMLPEPRVIVHRRLKCFGAGESKIEQLLPDLIRRGREPTVGITASRGTITLRVTASGTNESECESAMAPTLDEIRTTLGDLVFGEEDDELEHAVSRLLRERKQKVAVFERGTNGLISHWFSQLDDGALACGWVDDHHAPPPSDDADGRTNQTAHLAMFVRKKNGADIGLAVSAPQSGTVATFDEVNVAIADGRETVTKTFTFAAHPDIEKTLAAKRALNMLRHHLLKQHST